MIHFILSLFLILGFQNEVTTASFPGESYRCAIYRIPIDFTSIAHMRPGKPAMDTSYTYIIEYGKSIVYQISDAGDLVYTSPVMIGKFDY